MKMKKLPALLIVLACLPFAVTAQNWEVGIFVGGSNYSGDLSPTPIVFDETNPAFGGLIRYNIQPYLTFKGNVYYGKISGTDENAQTEQNRRRNLSFRSNVLDIGGQFEVNILGFEPGNYERKFSPYAFAGLSVFKFDPEAYFNDEWVRLQPLGTEGQGTTQYNEREKYALTQISVPFGVGLKYNFSGNWNLGVEVGWRKTFTDYLDDVSNTYASLQVLRNQSGSLSAQLSNRSAELDGEMFPNEFDEEYDTYYRGNPTNMDWYIFPGLTLSYTIIPKECFKF